MQQNNKKTETQNIPPLMQLFTFVSTQPIAISYIDELIIPFLFPVNEMGFFLQLKQKSAMQTYLA